MESRRGEGYKEDDDRVVKVISGLDKSDCQGEEEERHYWEEDEEESVEKVTIIVRPSSRRSVLVSHLCK